MIITESNNNADNNSANYNENKNDDNNSKNSNNCLHTLQFCFFVFEVVVVDVRKTFTRNRFKYVSSILCIVDWTFNCLSCRIKETQIRCCKLVI